MVMQATTMAAILGRRHWRASCLSEEDGGGGERRGRRRETEEGR